MARRLAAERNGKNEVTKTGDAHIDFKKLMEAQEFASALDLLQVPEFTASEIEQKREEAYVAWRKHADSAFQSGGYESAYQDYAAMAARFNAPPEVNDLMLLQARSNLGLGSEDFTAARQALGKITVIPQTRESPRDRAYFLVKVIVEIQGEKKLDNLVELYKVWKEQHDKAAKLSTRTDGNIWNITKDEIEHLEDARSAVIGNWLRTAQKLQASDLPTIETIVELDPDNADALVAKADLHLQLGARSEFDEAMKQRASLTSTPRYFGQRARLLDAYFALTSSSASEKQVTAALGAVSSLMSSFKDRGPVLAAAVRDLANREQKYRSTGRGVDA